MNRRTFLKIAGMTSITFAAGCTSNPETSLFSLVEAPDDMVPGKADWYASTCRECPAGCGIIAKNREGRVVKVEGNPLHPINAGKLCMRGQAALQGIYNPDRIKTPLLKEKDQLRPISFSQAETLLHEKASQAAHKGRNKIYMLTEVVGESLYTLFTESLQRWRSPPPLVFEPYAYEALKTANEKILGIEGLPAYHMDKADVLVSLGADFLETWLSPVEYARKFKSMHALNHGRKGFFCHVSAYQSLTGVNSDLWLSCKPGTEVHVAMGLVHHAMASGRGKNLPGSLVSTIKQVSSPFTKEAVVRASGISAENFDRMATRLATAKKPLIIGPGSTCDNALQTNMAVNLLNLIFDPQLMLFDFEGRHRVETAARRSEVLAFFECLNQEPVDLLLLNNTNPVFSMPSESTVIEALKQKRLFVVSFSSFMDETTALADLVIPTRLPLETWDEYSGRRGMVSTLQPAMGHLTDAPSIGDVFLRSNGGQKPDNYTVYLYRHLKEKKRIENPKAWVEAIQQGGIFNQNHRTPSFQPAEIEPALLHKTFDNLSLPSASELAFMAVPSIRFFDGRGANRPWLCEVPDPLTQVAWQTPVLMHPQTMKTKGLAQEDIVEIQSETGRLNAPVYETEGVHPGSLVMAIGQGHRNYGRYAAHMGTNPLVLLPPETEPVSGGPLCATTTVSVRATGRTVKLAHTDGSRTQHGRKIALSVFLDELEHGKSHEKHGLTMEDFPLTLPLPQGYDPQRDFYPPHDHDTYRWGMTVDLDKCIGCGACAAACYAENNIGVVGVKRIVEGREMAWLRVERYQDPERGEKITFLPMMCQHCDNAPCESVCPVYAPHHSKEGLNNQIYNRCIGTRFCSQNCPYKVRRFNWFDWEWPDPLSLQLNPNVTVRSKGVMEKCSFCIQRIKYAHGVAKNEKRMIEDGDVVPACMQTCPTDAIIFGNLMDPKSRVRKRATDPRAYQVMGYLNTKPAVIYLKKVVQKI
ncbi:MAG TPA: molybdopterin dinucleotide binding domain-containing protein [Desulfobacterales bacterium]|nr:molybdopterin dinucleotide binding domain-containing protein [Desulfobacterales bacterium]